MTGDWSCFWLPLTITDGEKILLLPLMIFDYFQPSSIFINVTDIYYLVLIVKLTIPKTKF